MTKTSRAANPVQICLGIFGEIKVDDHIDRLYINATGQKIRTDKISTDTVAEIVKNSIAIMLQHASVRIETGITKFRDFLGEEFHSIGGIAKDDRLVDLQLREQRVQAVDFLLFFNECVVLCYTSECELIHEIYFIGICHMLVLTMVSI